MANEWFVVRKTPKKGYGAFAKKNIPDETKIIEYIGPKVTQKQADIISDREDEEGNFYLFELNKRYHIDGSVKWNRARYLNHSCDPNCEVEIIKGHIWISSIRDIKKGEELTYDYGLDHDVAVDHPCHCGAKQCRKFIMAEDEHKKFLKKFGNKKR